MAAIGGVRRSTSDLADRALTHKQLRSAHDAHERGPASGLGINGWTGYGRPSLRQIDARAMHTRADERVILLS